VGSFVQPHAGSRRKPEDSPWVIVEGVVALALLVVLIGGASAVATWGVIKGLGLLGVP